MGCPSEMIGTQIRCATCSETFWAKKSMLRSFGAMAIVASALLGALLGPVGVIIDYFCYKDKGALVGLAAWVAAWCFVAALVKSASERPVTYGYESPTSAARYDSAAFSVHSIS